MIRVVKIKLTTGKWISADLSGCDMSKLDSIVQFLITSYKADNKRALGSLDYYNIEYVPSFKDIWDKYSFLYKDVKNV